jgi:GR25 family glycosyltransferase involved in LPS biosynthesis
MLLQDQAVDVLNRIPKVELAFNGDCAQAIGVELPVAVINLPHRTDRWDAVSSRMANVGLDNLIRVPAFEGVRLALEPLAPLLGQPADAIESPPTSHLALTRPGVGCFLSHLAVWRWIIDNAIPRMLIFEDDANPEANFDRLRFRRVLDQLSHDAGLVLFGHLIMNGMAEEPQGSELPRIYYFNGTLAYLITPAACRFLISRLLPINGHIDHEISKVLIECRHIFSARYVAPPLFEPDWSLRSDCYVPLLEESEADRALGALLNANRDRLLQDGRPLKERHVA